MKYSDLKKKYGDNRVQRTLHISEKFKYVYVTNPKAACTAMKLYLSRAEVGDPEFVPERYHDRKALPLLRPGQIAKEQREHLLDGAFFRFSFVRHPIKRAVSSYGDKILSYRDPRFKVQILQYLGRDENDLEQPVSFKDFLLAIKSQDLSTIDGHFRPQVFNLYIGDVEYDLIGKVENIQEDFASLRGKLGLPDYPLEARNVKTHVVKPGDIVDSECEALLRDIYARDFEVFNYT